MANINMTSEPTPAKRKTMRNYWFEHVRKTRKKLSKGKDKPATHREAMTQASATWPENREKLKKKLEREQKRLDKLEKSSK
jgi:hypothetical protein